MVQEALFHHIKCLVGLFLLSKRTCFTSIFNSTISSESPNSNNYLLNKLFTVFYESLYTSWLKLYFLKKIFAFIKHLIRNNGLDSLKLQCTSSLFLGITWEWTIIKERSIVNFSNFCHIHVSITFFSKKKHHRTGFLLLQLDKLQTFFFYFSIESVSFEFNPSKFLQKLRAKLSVRSVNISEYKGKKTDLVILLGSVLWLVLGTLLVIFQLFTVSLFITFSYSKKNVLVYCYEKTE